MRRTLSAAACAVTLVAAGDATAVAGTVSADATTVTYTASPGADNAVEAITSSSNAVRIRDSVGLTAVAPCVQANATNVDCPLPGGGMVVVNVLDGEDSVSGIPLSSHRLTANLGPGNDRAIAGPADDVLNGEAGDDFISLDHNGGLRFTASGNDQVLGGEGDDLIVLPGGADDISGGTGIDKLIYVAETISFGKSPAAASYTLDDVANDGIAGDASNVRSDVESLASVETERQESGTPTASPPYYSGTPIAEGPATLRGTAVPNTLMGGSGGDDLDPGAGNDLAVGGDGDDTIRTADGYADTVKCGPGADTALADTLDVVSETCETVTRADAGNANDVPEVPDVPEDLPPVVAFASPAPGAVTTGATTLVANASDDRGVSAVQFVDDDQIVCNDTEAPYTCVYQPRGEDVGRNTLTAIAIDSAQQTASDRRVFTVPRFAPRSVSLTVSPRRDARMPLRFTSTGRVALPPQVSPALGCTGAFVAVQFKAGNNTISNRRARLTPQCTFRSRVTFRSRRRFRTRRSLRVFAVFAGNAVLIGETSPYAVVAVR